MDHVASASQAGGIPVGKRDSRTVVSVVIPVYNVEPYLRECVDSALAQTYASLEIILVDDGSTDGGPSICDGYASQDNRVRVIHQRNAGLSAARNVGVQSSTGQLVTFLDSDDWWLPTFVSSLVDALEVHPEAGIAMSTFARVPGSAWVPPVEEARPFNSAEAIGLFAGNHHTLLTIACAKLIRRDLLEDVRFPVGRLHEDEFTTYRLFLRSSSVLVPHPLYLYRQRPTGIVSSPLTPERLLDAVQAAEQQVADLRAAGHDRAAAWATGQMLRKRMRLIALLRSSGRTEEAAQQSALLQDAASVEGGWEESPAFQILGRVARRSPMAAVHLFTGAARLKQSARRVSSWVPRSVSAVAPRGNP